MKLLILSLVFIMNLAQAQTNAAQPEVSSKIAPEKKQSIVKHHHKKMKHKKKHHKVRKHS